MKTCGLFAPTTFPHNHNGARHGTWGSRAGRQRRIDFIALPLCSQRSASAGVCADIDLTIDKDDHSPVAATLSYKHQCQQKLLRRRVAICRRSAMEDEQSRRDFAASIRSLQPPPWHMHAHDYHSWLVLNLRCILAICFPLKVVQPNKEWISQTTWSAMNNRRFLRLRFCSLRAIALRDRKKSLLQLWWSVWAKKQSCIDH